MRRLPEVSWLEVPRFTRRELAAQLAGLAGGAGGQPGGCGGVRPVAGQPVFRRAAVRRRRRSRRWGRCPGCCGRCCWPGCASCRRVPSGCWAVAAVAGRWVSHDWLAAVAGGPEEELTGPLREAVGRGLLLVTPRERAGQEVYEFRHALLQEAVYADLLPGQRARLHGAYAHAIASARRRPGGSAVRRGAGRALVSGRPVRRGAGLVGAGRRQRGAGVRARGGGPPLRTRGGAMGPGTRCRGPGRRQPGQPAHKGGAGLGVRR